MRLPTDPWNNCKSGIKTTMSVMQIAWGLSQPRHDSADLYAGNHFPQQLSEFHSNALVCPVDYSVHAHTEPRDTHALKHDHPNICSAFCPMQPADTQTQPIICMRYGMKLQDKTHAALRKRSWTLSMALKTILMGHPCWNTFGLFLKNDPLTSNHNKHPTTME